MGSNQMSNAPVYYALVQIRFAPVAAMAKYVDEIQDLLRTQGYPIFETNDMTQLSFEMNVQGGAPMPQVSTSLMWMLVNESRTAGFVLGKDYLTFHTTEYKTKEEFIPEILKGLTAVAKVTNLSFITRIGLRYLDAVIPKPGEDYREYLNDGLHNLKIDLEQVQSINEMVFKTEVEPLVNNGIFIVRVYSAESQLGYPPGIETHGLVACSKLTDTPVMWHAIVDTDHFVEENMPVDIDGLDKQIRSLHAVIDKGFKHVVSQHALDVWK